MPAKQNIYGLDGATWRGVHVDAAGDLQVDVLTSGLPLGGATAANQVITHGYIDGIEGLLGAGLPVALDATALKVKEQSPLAGFATAVNQATIIGHIDGIEGLLGAGLPIALDATAMKVKEQNWPAEYPLPAAQVASLQQVTEQGTPSVHLYGYDGTNWQTLLTESAAQKNLRVKLYDGANAIFTDLADASVPIDQRGLMTISPVYGLDGAVYGSIRAQTPSIDGVTRNYRALFTTAFLHGYNGAMWDRLRVMTPANAFATPTFALQTASFLMGYDGADWNMVRVNTSGQLETDEQFGGNVYSKTMTMTADTATRFETSAKKLRDIVIIVKTNDMLLGETGVEVYPVGAGETVGFTKVDISTLYFKNAGAGNNGVITILGVEE